MRTALITAAFLTALAVAAPAPEDKRAEKAGPGDNTPPAGFTALFNGRDLSGWKVVGGKSDNWRVEPDRKVLATLGGDQGWLLTEKEYGDFELRLEVRVNPRANTGVALRTSHGPFPGGRLSQGMEVQLADDGWHRAMFAWYGKKHLTGGIFDLVAPSREAARPVGGWNALRITARGARVTVELNGTRVVDEDLAKFRGKAPKHPNLLAPKGHIGLQSFQGRAEFRRLAVRPLPPEGKP
jgi:hypothetical protein